MCLTEQQIIALAEQIIGNNAIFPTKMAFVKSDNSGTSQISIAFDKSHRPHTQGARIIEFARALLEVANGKLLGARYRQNSA